jgi:hypothetical protein
MSYEYDRKPAQRVFSIPVPGLRQAVGFGDVIARATRAVGIQPCGGCKARQQWLNQRLQLRPRGGR